MTPSSRPPSPATRGWRLQTKLIVSMLLVGVVPLLVGLGMAFWQGSKEIHEVSGESFKALATEAARKLDLLVGEEIARTSSIAADPVIVRELEHRRDLALAAGGKPSPSLDGTSAQMGGQRPGRREGHHGQSVWPASCGNTIPAPEVSRTSSFRRWSEAPHGCCL